MQCLFSKERAMVNLLIMARIFTICAVVWEIEASLSASISIRCEYLNRFSEGWVENYRSR